MELPPGLLDVLINVGGFGLLLWFLINDRKEHRTALADRDKTIDAKDATIADLNAKLVSAYRETLPVLTEASNALELVGGVLPAIAAAEPARIAGGKR